MIVDARVAMKASKKVGGNIPWFCEYLNVYKKS
jgi:hypothetical protein